MAASYPHFNVRLPFPAAGRNFLEQARCAETAKLALAALRQILFKRSIHRGD